MANKGLPWCFAMACACAITTLAFAAQPTRELKARHADRNKDGTVDAKELHMEKTWEQKQAKVNWGWEKKADTNNDGVVDAVEMAQWKNKRRAWLKDKAVVNTPLEKKFDANNDGMLEPAEIKAMIHDRHVLISTEGEAKVDTQIEELYDGNNDGILDKSEAEEMLADTEQ